MKKFPKIILTAAIFILFLFWVQNTSFDSFIKSKAKIDVKRAQDIAISYIKNLDQYKKYGGKDISQMFDPIAECPNCWRLGYEFVLEEKREDDLPFKGKIIIELKGNQISSVKYEEVNDQGNQITNFQECINNQYQELQGNCSRCPKKCKTSGGEIFIQEPNDPVYLLLEEIEKDNSIDFTEIQDVNFNWNYYDGIMMQKIKIDGLGFHAQNITKSAASIGRYLKDKGFASNTDNISSSDSTGLEGYQKDETVCLVQEIINQQIEVSPTQNSPRSIKINCGIMENDQEKGNQ